MKKRHRYVVIALSLSVVIVLTALFAVIYLVYVKGEETPLTSSLKKSLDLPIGSINGQWIAFKEFDQRVQASRAFLDNQNFADYGIRIDFETEDGKKRFEIVKREVLNVLIEAKMIEMLAEREGVTLSEEELMMELSRAITDSEFAQERMSLYGFDSPTFAQHIVRPQLLLKKVEAHFYKTNPITQAMYTTISNAQDELADGVDFADVARTYSDGATAQDGGALGFFKQGQMLQAAIPQSVEAIAFTLEKGAVSDVIESALGLHIIRIDDIILDAAGEKEMVSVSQIFVKRNENFSDYIEKEMRKAQIKLWTPKYTWDTQTARALFVDETLLTFERDALREIEEQLSL